jgi:diguanylate cyclase (GGDEF)-like protein
MTSQSPPLPPAQAFPGSERFTRDALTGLPNEHLFRLQLPMEFDRAREQETNAAFLVIKVDEIVAINEKYGRSSGDEALRAVAYVLENVRAGPDRQSHVVFRLGGPSFGYYLPQCSAPQARALAEEIRDKVQLSETYLQRLTVSIGVVNFYELFMEEGSREQLARRIEQTALHRLDIAGRQGSNTICDSSPTSDAAVSSRPVVLLVDPDPGSMELLIRSLEAAELVVQVYRDGESAMEAVQKSRPSVIVCEAMSPRLDGFTIRERLQANAAWSAIPFILVSHRKNEEMIRKAVERDIRHFFRKPVSLTEVAGLLLNITRRAAG